MHFKNSHLMSVLFRNFFSKNQSKFCASSRLRSFRLTRLDSSSDLGRKFSKLASSLLIKFCEKYYINRLSHRVNLITFKCYSMNWKFKAGFVSSFECKFDMSSDKLDMTCSWSMLRVAKCKTISYLSSLPNLSKITSLQLFVN